jgi:hypothetical protein
MVLFRQLQRLEGIYLDSVGDLDILVGSLLLLGDVCSDLTLSVKLTL